MCLQDESVKERTGMKFHLFLTGMSKNIYIHSNKKCQVAWLNYIADTMWV